jgi:hypothetical protein
MSTLRTLKKMFLGETWILPLGLAALLVLGALLHDAAPDSWHDAGGIVLLAGVALVLVASVMRSARRR